MLRALSIRNIAVAKDVNIEFDRGFTVLTGETGAGKSILIDCLELIAGARASRDMLRTGENVAEIRTIFSTDTDAVSSEKISEFTDENGEIEIYRSFGADGRGTTKINGHSVPISTLRDICDSLIGISGQSDSRALSDKSLHLKMLDGYAENESLKQNYLSVYTRLIENRNEYAKLRENLRDKAMMTDILKYQITEIDSAKLTDDSEPEKLEKLLRRARAAEKVSKCVSLIKRALTDAEKGSASYLVEKASAAYRQLGDAVDNADALADRLDAIRYELIDISETAGDILGDELDDPERAINAAESRLRQIDKLKNKYGTTVEEIKEFRNGAAKKLKGLEEGDGYLYSLDREYAELKKEAAASAEKLTESRISAGNELAEKVCTYLRELDMPKIKFFVRVAKASGENDGFGTDGRDDVSFMISANAGEAPVELGHAASGGELARTMLSLKCALSERHPSDTYIFDEIDTGVSGGTSEKMGRMLLELSRKSQVVCITHSPQIASLADVHLRISKSERDGRTESRVDVLDREGRIGEISRIIGGVDITETQINAAAEMIDKK